MKVQPAKWIFERAKDVAAFANHLGGTLLIGASEVDGELKAYVGLSVKDAEAVRDDYSKAVADRCQPRPAIDFEQFDCESDPTKRIVAINVQPSLNLVGVKVRADKTNEGFGGELYAYPVRSGTDARYLAPGELAMFMTPQIRRAFVLLSRIPPKTLVTIAKSTPPPSVSRISMTWAFDGVDEEQNLVRFMTETKPVNLPLDRVLTAYQSADLRWHVVMDVYD
ncbi:MAG: ATP-binding protein [Kofleriaceae bacterium]